MKRAKLAAAALALAALSACGPTGKARPGTQARWESQLRAAQGQPTAALSQSLTGRRVAEEGPRCLKDRVRNGAFLRSEVARMERARSSTPVEGDWRGKDLSRFPAPQAQFLSGNADWIATDNRDFTSCTDLPCILNLAYGSGAREEGWRIYAFYLSMGIPISVRDYVPATSSKWTPNSARVHFDAPFEAHLFSAQELISFWKLSFLLPDVYRSLGSQRFHRIPAGEQQPSPSWCPLREVDLQGRCVCPDRFKTVDGDCKFEFESGVCGDSWGKSDHGFIRLKRCIDEDDFSKGVFYQSDDPSLKDTGIMGSFYKTTTHEMTHTWDRFVSTGRGPDGYLLTYATTEEWKALSGWHMENLTRETSNGNQVFSSKWTPTPGKDGFVRAYASESPSEDLAETAAWVRMRPTLVVQRSPAKAAFLSRKLFGGRTYDATGLKSFYVESATQEVSTQLLEVVESCLARAAAGGASSGAAPVLSEAHLALEHPLPESVVSCLESDLGVRVGAALDRLRGVEWEACDLLATDEQPVRKEIYSRVSAEVSRLVGQNLERAPAIAAARKLREVLVLQVDPREAYVHCFKNAQPESCYQQLLGDAFDQQAQPMVSVLGDLLPSERSAYLALNPYDQARLQSEQFYRSVFAGIEPRIAALAAQRWEQCMLVPVGTAVPGDASLLTPFSGGTHFVSAEILSCINSAAESDLSGARDGFIKRLGLSVTDADVQGLIYQLLLPGYLDVLFKRAETEAAAEDGLRAQRKAGVLDVLLSTLTRETQWLDGAQLSDTAVAQCLVPAAEAFDAYFARAHEPLPTRFAALADIRTGWSRDACEKAIATPAIAKVLGERAKKAWTAALGSLDTAVSVRAKDKATDCLARNPATGRVVPWATREKRRKCLVADWSTLETQAIVDWELAAGKPFVSRHADAVTYLSAPAKRQRLQSDAVLAMEKR